MKRKPWKITKNEHTRIVFVGNDEVSYPIYTACREGDIKGNTELQAEKDVFLISAAPELLEACKLSLEIIKIARQYFPKSIQNSNKFDLENTCAAIGAAIYKAEGGQK